MSSKFEDHKKNLEQRKTKVEQIEGIRIKSQ